MASIDKRQAVRFNPVGLKAVLTIGTVENLISLTGEVIDISYNGIKIRLIESYNQSMDGQIALEVFLPNTELPLVLTGIIKHSNQTGEIGMHYMDCPVVEALDKFMFDCMKLANPSPNT